MARQNKCTQKELTFRLVDAISKDQADRIEPLINAGVNVNTTLLFDHSTPLCLAIEHGNIEVVRQLLCYLADINQPARNGMRPIHFAAHGGHTEVIKLLHKHGVDINSTTVTGNWTALHFAVSNLQEEVVKYLLERGASTYMRGYPVGNYSHPFHIRSVLVQDSHPLHRSRYMNTLSSVTAVHCMSVLIASDLHYSDDCRQYDDMVTQLIHLLHVLTDSSSDLNVECDSAETPIDLSLNATAISLAHSYSLSAIHHQADHAEVMVTAYFKWVKALIDSGGEVRPKWIHILSDIRQEYGEYDTNGYLDWMLRRLSCVMSLKSLCRNALRVCLARDLSAKVNLLPLPRLLMQYVTVL